MEHLIKPYICQFCIGKGSIVNLLENENCPNCGEINWEAGRIMNFKDYIREHGEYYTSETATGPILNTCGVYPKSFIRKM